MKRFLASFLAFVMALSLCIVPSAAAGANVTMEVAPPDGKTLTTLSKGDEVKVTVKNSAMTVKSFTCGFDFDADIFECISIEGGIEADKSKIYLVMTDGGLSPYALCDASTTTDANNNKKVGFARGSATEVKYNAGTLAIVTFKVKKVGTASFKLYESSDGSNGFNGTNIVVTNTETLAAPYTGTVTVPEDSDLTITNTSVVVSNPAAGHEYALTKKGEAAPSIYTSTAPIKFDGLTSETEYTLYVRVKGTSDHQASDASTKDIKTLSKPALPSSASVSISGTSKIGQPLTATPSGLPGDVTGLTYKWYRDGETDPISGADTNTYTPSTKDDVGKKIRVVVTAENYSGNVSDTTASTVDKADSTAPAAPTKESITANSITVAHTGTGLQFACVKACGTVTESNWTDEKVFDGLEASTAYDIYARVEATATHNASPASTKLTVTTLKGAVAGEFTYSTKAADYTGTANGATVTSTAHTTFTLKYNGEATAPTDAGEYALTAEVPAHGDYAASTVDLGKWTINAKDVTITPTSGLSKTYRATDPTLTYTTSIDGNATLKGKFDAAVGTTKLGRAAGEDVGSYAITIGNLSAGSNFKLTMATVNFTITAADYSYDVAAAQDFRTGSGLSAITAPASGSGVNGEAVNGTLNWYSDSGRTKAAVDTDLSSVTADNTVTLYWTFTTTNSNYTNTPKEGVTVFTAKNKTDLSASIVTTGITAMSKTYDGSAVSRSGSASVTGHTDLNSSLVYEWYKADDTKLTEAPKDAGSYYLKVSIPSENANYMGSAKVSFEISRKDVTITGLSVSDKVYDGGVTATVTGTAAISGKVDGDDVTVTEGTATFADKNVGTGKTVTFSGYSLSGAAVSNYSLSAQPDSVTANITAKNVTVTVTATNRDYVSGNRNVALVAGSVTGVIGSETVNVDVSGATGTMDDENVGTDKSVTVTGVALGGADKDNYKLKEQPTGVTVTINQIDPTTPTGLTGVKGQALSTVTLPAGWTWDNSSTTMNTTGSVSFKASYAGSTNYKAKSNIDVTVTVSDKELVTISGLTAAAGLTYNGSVQTGYTGTPSYSPAWSGTPVVTYYLNDGATKTDAANGGAAGEGLAPKNAGNYKVTIAIPDSDPTHTGHVTLDFSIAKKGITVKPKSFTITKGNAIPTFTLEYTGLVGSDTLTPGTAPTFTCYETGTTPVSTSTAAGTYTITWTNEGTTTFTGADNYDVIKTATATLTISNPSYSGGGSYTPSYTVSVDKTENGTVSVSPKSAAKGSTVTITVTPDKGYVLETLTALDKDGKELKLTAKDGKYTFTMPAGKVEVKATFMDDNTMLNYFVDVKAGDYFYDAVLWAAQKGITNGVNAVEFGPNLSCTRAQIVTFLWRAAGSPAPKSTAMPFSDVKAGSYYEQAVLWAVENGITGGTGDGKFSPDATCTRAQSVTFLYRAAGSPKVSSSAEFGDVATNAYYADAVAWAAKNGITGGIGGGLFGSGNDCTRAQIVTFLYRAYQGK